MDRAKHIDKKWFQEMIGRKGTPDPCKFCVPEIHSHAHAASICACSVADSVFCARVIAANQETDLSRRIRDCVHC